jgi:hypothetical protein
LLPQFIFQSVVGHRPTASTTPREQKNDRDNPPATDHANEEIKKRTHNS